MSAAVLQVDLAAIEANYRFLSRLHASGAVAGVLKANGYGLGAGLIGARLFTAGCRHFFTATLDEALALQPHVGDAMIGVLHGLVDAWAADSRARVGDGIIPVLSSLSEIRRWAGQGGGEGILHIDTGMSRLGLSAADVAMLAGNQDLLDRISVRYLMTHLVSSELPDDPVNEQQRIRFRKCCEKLPPAPRSIANSSGIFLGPAFASALARPGAALFGINPTPGNPNPMRPVVRLQAQVLQVRAIGVGDTVGYNATWRAERPSRIAAVAIGYADGWHRSLSNRGHACFDGTRVPLVGRVSMDLTTFDVTDLPQVQEGAWLELIGPDRPLDEIAAEAGTNAYEILTSLGPRIRRVHHG
jgi:alanine racemase